MEIELPNGQIAEFPDDMPHEHIERVLQSHFPMKSEIPSAGMKQQEQPGLFANLWKGLKQGYPHALKNDINAISGLAGRHPFDVQELEQGPLSQTVGQTAGSIGGHLSSVLPAAFASEAAIPGLLGASLGAGLAGAATTPGNYKKRLTEGLIEAAIPAGLKGLKEGGKLGLAAITRSPTPRKAADVIQSSYEAAHKIATQPLNEAKKLAYENNIGPIRIKPALLDDVPKILGKEEGVMRLLNKARSGDFEALDKVQSDLKKEYRILSSPDKSHADRLLGKDANSLADKILDGMKLHAEYKGHKNIANLITQGKKNYAELAELYLSNPTVSKLVGKEKVVPKNLLSKLESDSAYFNRLKTEIPSIGKMLKVRESQKKLKKAVKVGTSLAHGGALSKYITHEND